MNMKQSIIEEINKLKLLMNYNTKVTLNENMMIDNISLPKNSLINEQPLKTILRQLFGTADDTVIQSLKSSGNNARYLKSMKLLDDASVFGAAGFKNADELVSAMVAGTISKSQISALAKGLLKQGKVTGKLRTTLTNTAASMSIKDPRFANLTGNELRRALTKKGYDSAIADEIALKFSSKIAKNKSKVQLSPKDLDDTINNISSVPIESVKSWSSLKKWGLGIGLSLATIATIYYFYNDDEIPEIITNDGDVPTTGTTVTTGTTETTGTTVTTGTKRYRRCESEGRYTKGCITEPTGVIGKVQACLGITQDGKFWNITQKALEAKGYPNGFTINDVNNICGTPQYAPAAQRPEDDEFNVDVDGENVSDILNI